MARNPLDEAAILYKRRRWEQTISLLEPLSGMYRENAVYHVMLGTAYLYREDTGGAWSSFRRAQAADFRNVQANLGLAAVHIRRGETDKAVQLYVDILEQHPHEHKARRGLELLRRGTFSGQDAPGNVVRRLYPAPPVSRLPLLVVPVVVAIIIAAVVVGDEVIKTLAERNVDRPGFAEIVLTPDERKSPVSSGGTFRYVLTEPEAIGTFDKAKKLFADYRDEAAMVELNRLRLSNASTGIKGKALGLTQYLREPSFLNLPDRFGYEDIRKEPALYEGVGVVWSGLPANINDDADGTHFELLVGYENRLKLQGIVKVVMNTAVKVEPDVPLEVLGRPRNLTDGTWYLEGIGIHQKQAGQ